MGDEAAKEKRAPATPVAVGAQFSNVDASGDPAALVRYLDDTAQRLRERKRASYALLDLKPGDAVLDVGCGPQCQDQYEWCADCCGAHRVPPLLTQDQRATLGCRQPSRGGAPACPVGSSCLGEGAGDVGGGIELVAGALVMLGYWSSPQSSLSWLQRRVWL